MRPVLLCSVLITLLCLPSAAQDAPPALRDGYFNLYLDGPGFTLTIQHEDSLVSTVDVPKGVLLGIEASATDNPEANESGAHGAFPLTFRGDIVVRTRRADTISPNEPQSMHMIMDKAPFKLVLPNVILKVEQAAGAAKPEETEL
ncbi:MAG: hypothetical protein RhofKO_24210 [Rhodothermales bacterium]